MNYTKGEWKAEKLLVDKHGIITKEAWEINTPEYQVVAFTEHWAPIRKEADAHLIATAPDMYEALKRLYGIMAKDCGGCIRLENALLEAQEALAKAEGK